MKQLSSQARTKNWSQGNTLLGVLVVISAILLAIIYVTSPKTHALSDELGYMTQALDFSKSLDLETRRYYFESLITQTPPLRPSHTPGFAITLGAFIKFVGFNEQSLKLFNFALLGLFVVFYYHFLIRHLTDGNKHAAFLICFMLLSYPLVNLTSIMAETLVLVSTGLLIYLMFYYLPKNEHVGSAVMCALFFWYCYIIRPNIVLLLPSFVLFYPRKNKKFIIKVLFILLVLYPLAHFLTRNRMAYPYGFMWQLNHADGLSTKLGLLLGNFGTNVVRIWDFGNEARYALSKILFYQISLLALLSYPFLRQRERYLYRIVILYFCINTFMVYVVYDNFDWKFLRVSIQFVPFYIFFIVMGLYGLLGGRGGRRYSHWWRLVTIFLLVEFLGANAYHLHSRNISQSKKAGYELAKIDFFNRHLYEDEEYTILTDLLPQRFTLNFSKSNVTYLFSYRHFNQKTFNIVNRKMDYDCIFLGNNDPYIRETITNDGYQIWRDGKISVFVRPGDVHKMKRSGTVTTTS